MNGRFLLLFKLFTQFILFLTLGINCFAQTPTQHPTQTTQDFTVNYNDVQIVRNLYALRFQDIQPAKGQSWVLAHVVPRQELDENLLPKRPLDAVQHGDLHVLLRLSDSTDTNQEEYAWLDRYPITDVAAYSSRTDAGVNPAYQQSVGGGGEGGYVICRINKAIKAISPEGYLRYDPAYLIPATSRDEISPALKFYASHPGLFNGDNPLPQIYPQRQSELYKLLLDKNVFVATAAFRTLVANVPVNASALRPYLERMQGIPLAFGCYALLRRSSQHQNSTDSGFGLLLSLASSSLITHRRNDFLVAVCAMEFDMLPYGAGQDVSTLRKRLTESQAK